jgi:alpha-beta hydrolase superfamily lysophospholipase
MRSGRRSAIGLLLGISIFGCVAVCGVAGSAAAAEASQSPIITAPTKTNYVVNGRAVTMICAGRGRIPVVFQAGGNDPGAYWRGLITALGPDVLTCVFDRPGVAPSEASPTLLTPRSVSATLSAVLKQAGLRSRIILVGHSIGGLNSLVYGATHPKQVAGAVLFDPSEAKFFEITNAAPILTSYGYDPTAVFTQIRAVKHWPTVPLAVLSRDPARAIADGQATPEQERVWTMGARAYARLSPHGIRTVVKDSSHYVYIDAPDAAATAVRTVLRDAS